MRRFEEMEPSPAVRARRTMVAEGIRSSASSGSRSSSRRSARSSSGSSRAADEEWELLQQSSAGVRILNQWGSAGRSRSDWPPAHARDNKAEARSIRMTSGRGISSQGVRVLDDDGPLAGLDGYYIGELFVTEKNIGYGSHGTVVHEGYVRDGHPVAVKRLVIEFYRKARDKIHNLIQSGDLEHPNVVRCYALEEDQHFMYVGLEKCDFNIRQMIMGTGSRPSSGQQSSNSSSGSYSQTSSRSHSRTSSGSTASSRGSDFSYESSASSLPAVEIVREVEGVSKPCLKFVASSGSEEVIIPLWDSHGRPTPVLTKLTRDMVAGVAHLHSRGVVHRNLKPHNILVKVCGRHQLEAKISDTGISSHLDSKMRSFTKTHATGLGKTGWQAPEQILNRKRTQAGDMFTLGCILFFCISGGRHPFGDKYERDRNIIDGAPNLWPIGHLPEAMDLIGDLLHPEPSERPTAAQALAHPMLWTAEERLAFLCHASNRMEKESWAKDSELLHSLEMTFPVTLDDRPWNEKLEEEFVRNLMQFRKYDFDSVRDLLHVINHKFENYRELPKEVKELVGPIPEGYDHYFRLRFPNLLIGVYRVLYEFCQDEKQMRRYFNLQLDSFS